MDGRPARELSIELSMMRRLLDNLPAMVAYWDAEQRCRYANRAYEVWFGVTPESLLGRHIRDLLGPLYALNQPYIEAALRGQPQEFERTIPDPAGGPARHSQANYIPDIVDQVVRGFYVLVVDISARKKAEEAARLSQARFAGIISISLDAIITVDENGRIILFNQGAETIFGYAAAEALGKPIGTLLPERFRQKHDEHIARTAQGPDTSRRMSERNGQIFGLRKDGQEFPAEAAISRIEVGGEKLLTVVLRDITARKKLEAELRLLVEAGTVLASSLDYEQTLRNIARLIADNVGDLCIVDVVDPRGGFRRLATAHRDPSKAAACAALESLPIDAEHAIARAAMQSGKPVLYREIDSAFIERNAQDAEHLRVLRELSPRSSLSVPILSQGVILGAIALVSSTPGRYGEADIPLAEELARRAGVAIESARLYETATGAIRARDDVLGVVAHDLRGPLNSIALASQLLRRQLPENDRAAKSVETIERAGARAHRLIRDLLDVTRIEAGRLPIERERLASRELVFDAAEAQQLPASAQSIELRIDADRDLPAVSADRDRVLQVFDNLAGNALKFTPSGGHITIGAEPRFGEVVFRVEDDGPGIPAEQLPHVFDRFWQGAARESRRGAGLGLPICKGIVEAHGGRIWAESSPRGTTFYFALPAAEGVEDAIPRLH